MQTIIYRTVEIGEDIPDDAEFQKADGSWVPFYALGEAMFPWSVLVPRPHVNTTIPSGMLRVPMVVGARS